MTQKLFTRNFMLLILGQLTSLFGNFILKLALSMYVLEATGSAGPSRICRYFIRCNDTNDPSFSLRRHSCRQGR